MIRKVSLLLLALLATQARAEDPQSIDLQGPSSVFAGEEAIFYSRTSDDPIELEARSAKGTLTTFTNSRVFDEGAYRVSVVGARATLGEMAIAGIGVPRRAHSLGLVVRPLPPVVTPDMPIEKRLATIQIYVWDGDRSTQGRILERTGKTLGPRLAPDAYGVKWVLAGRQATRRNVDFAISELARRGYIIDMYSAAHGYPIGLADGHWTNVASNPDMKAVRIFYTTACHGAEGKDEFLAAGVKSYVAAPDINWINSFHMKSFNRALGNGKSVTAANDEAHGKIDRIISSWPGRVIGRWWFGSDEAYRDAREGTRPQVFGDPNVTLFTDTQRGGIEAKREAKEGILTKLARIGIGN